MGRYLHHKSALIREKCDYLLSRSLTDITCNQEKCDHLLSRSNSWTALTTMPSYMCIRSCGKSCVPLPRRRAKPSGLGSETLLLSSPLLGVPFAGKSSEMSSLGSPDRGPRAQCHQLQRRTAHYSMTFRLYVCSCLPCAC